MITKQDLDRWYDEGRKPLSKEKKQAIRELIVSWNNLAKNINRFGNLGKIPLPKEYKCKSKEQWVEIITGLQLTKVNEWKDLRIKHN